MQCCDLSVNANLELNYIEGVFPLRSVPLALNSSVPMDCRPVARLTKAIVYLNMVRLQLLIPNNKLFIISL